MNIDDIRGALDRRLTDHAARWLDESCAAVTADPSALATRFPAAGRRCGRGPLDCAAPGPAGWTVDDAARALLLTALPLSGAQLADHVAQAYRLGDAAEKRGVLRALAMVDVGDAAVPLVRDALRSNDTRLIAAAVGPYAAEHLDEAGWRHAVLKCVFLGVPLATVADLTRRADAELDRMLTAFARERVAAGRAVPDDVHLVLDRSHQEA